jgi:hypothetical protein
MDLFYRNYDPVLGRMNQVDPMASQLSSLSPYNYSGNSPVVYNDPKGDLFRGKAFCSWCNRGGGTDPGGFDPNNRIMDNGVFGRPYPGRPPLIGLSRSDRNFFFSSYNTLMNSPFAQASFAVEQNGTAYGYNLLLNVTGQVIFAARDNNVTLASNGGWLIGNSTTVSDYGSGVSFTTGLTYSSGPHGPSDTSKELDKYGFLSGTFFGGIETGVEQSLRSLERVKVITGQAGNGAYISEYRNAVSLANKGTYVNAATANSAFKWGGRLLATGVISYSAVDLAINGGTNQDIARLGVQSAIAVIGFLGPIGFGVSLGLSLIEMNGGFDWVYDNFDNSTVHKIGN